MLLKLDENIPFEAATLLRAAGHQPDTVHDEVFSEQRTHAFQSWSVRNGGRLSLWTLISRTFVRMRRPNTRESWCSGHIDKMWRAS